MNAGYININFHGIMPFICGIFLLILGSFVLSKNSKSRINISWFFLCLTTAAWTLSYSFAYFLNKEETLILSLFKIGYMGVIFIPILWYQFVVYFLNLHKERKALSFIYLIGFTFVFLLFRTDFFMNGVYKYYWGYYPKVNFFIHPIFFLFYSILWCYSAILLYRNMRREKFPLVKNRIKYIFWSLVVVLPGLGDFLGNYGIEFYPLGGAILVTICLIIVAYGIYKCRLMDIKFAITRLGIFGAVYALVLGIPFGITYWGKDALLNIFGNNWYWIPLIITTIFATAGPFIYLFIQRKAEDRLLKEERGDQQFILQASTGMTRIRNLKKLLGLIDHILSQKLRVNNVAIYLLDPETNQYVLKASRFKYDNLISIKIDDPLIQWLKEDNSPLVYEEIKMRADMETNNHSLKEIKSQMEDLSASVIIPAIMQDYILGFLILGKRKTRRMYTTDLLNALSVLSNQAALAIENAIFYEETGKTLAQQFQESRLKSLGQFSGGIAHQVYNTLNAITFGGGVLKEMLKMYDFKNLPPEKLEEFKNKFIEKIDEMITRAERGAEVTEAIKNYAKADKAPTTPSATSFKKVIFDCKELALLKHKDDKLVFELIEDYPKDITLWVNLSTFQDAIFNALDNSCDAMVSKRDLIEAKRLDIKDYKPQIIIRGKVNKTMFEFEIEDNGIGMTDEQLRHSIGTPLFTTKGKGTGLGVPMMYQFVRQNKGDIRVESEHQKWTKIIISLPLATKEQIEQSKEKVNGNNNQ